MSDKFVNNEIEIMIYFYYNFFCNLLNFNFIVAHCVCNSFKSNLFYCNISFKL